MTVNALVFVLLASSLTAAGAAISADRVATRKARGEAEHEALRIQNRFVRENLLHDIAIAEANAQDQKKALQIVSALRRSGDKDFALLEIAEVEVKSHHVSAAWKTANMITDPLHQSAAIEAIAVGQFETGDQSGALHTVRLIADETMREGAFAGWRKPLFDALTTQKSFVPLSDMTLPFGSAVI